jgi:microcystin degradation protein MlrC
MPTFDLGRGGRPLRLGYGRIFHEANADSPLQTSQSDFHALHHLAGDDLAAATTLRGTELAGFMPQAELSGFRLAASLAGGVETVPLVSSLAVSGGPLTAETFAWLLDGLLAAITAAGPLDGLYLALHGSMEVTGLAEAPEAVILQKVRQLLGPEAVIAVSYDLHGNLSAGLVDPVDVLVAYRSNPHWDMGPTGFRAGNRLIRVVRGRAKPVHAWRKLPLVLGGGMTIDFLAPMRGVFRAMKQLERDPRVLTASLFMVHPYTSAENLGWAVHVSTDGDPALAEALADQLADLAWQVRQAPLPPMLSVGAALDQAKASPWRRLGPVTLIDVDDIVGAGAPGGNTRLVAALAANDRGLKAYVPLHDPAAVALTWDTPVGQPLTVTLQGTPGYGQPVVTLQATVAGKAETVFGRMVRLDSGSFHVVVTDLPPMPISPTFWTLVGLSARAADVIVQKNFFHYRILYALISFQHLPVVSDGATSLVRVAQRQTRVPTYPTTDLADWREHEPLMRQQPRR